MTLDADKFNASSSETGLAFGHGVDGSTSIGNAPVTVSSKPASPTVERTETALDGIATAESPTAKSLGKGSLPSRPTASGGAESPVNPADTDSFRSTASASAFRSSPWVTFGLCVSFGLIATTT
ncbi:hypothetical protein XPA_001459 [Xanthoria parietina]